MIFLRQSTASQEVLLGPFLDDTDGKTAETGLTIANTDIKIWKRGGTTEASKNSGGATHIASGRYYAVLDATDTDTVGEIVVSVHVAGALPVRQVCCVLEEAVFDDLFATSSVGYLKPTTAGRTLDVTATGAAGIDWANVENQTTAVGLTGTTIATTQKVDVETIKTQALTAAAGITFPTSIASPTNITALNLTSFTVSGNTAFTGNVSMANGLTITQSTLNGHGIYVDGNGAGYAISTGGSVHIGNALEIENLVTFDNGFTVSGNVSVSGTTTLTGAVSATHASNDIRGVKLSGTIQTFDSLWTTLKKWLRLGFRKDAAIATDHAAELTDINADQGTGAGSYANTTDALEALRDNIGTAGAGLTTLATSANQTVMIDGIGFMTAQLMGACADAGTAAETYQITFGGATYTLDFVGLDSTGNRTSVTRTKT